jgi:hypothetical protein
MENIIIKFYFNLTLYFHKMIYLIILDFFHLLIGNMILVTNINNNKQFCKCCKKNLPLNLFVINGKSYWTCSTCCIKSKEVYQNKKWQLNAEITNKTPVNWLSYMIFYQKLLIRLRIKENVKIKKWSKSRVYIFLYCKYYYIWRKFKRKV